MNKLFFVTTFGLLITGCAAIPVEPGAQRVIVSPNQAPKSCKYLGQIVGNQGNFFTGNYTSNAHLEEGAMNDLRNKAAKLGANYVQLITARAGNTGTTSGYGYNGYMNTMSGHYAQTNITTVGNAYRCKPDSIGLS